MMHLSERIRAIARGNALHYHLKMQRYDGGQSLLHPGREPRPPPQRSSNGPAVAARARRTRIDSGGTLHPDEWPKERLVRFLDKVRVALTAEERRSFEAARAQVRLLKR